MQDVFLVFFVNLICDIDNMLILGTILRKYTYLKITFFAAVVLTLARTGYVVAVGGFSDVPIVHLLTGMILLFIAFKLVTRSIREEDIRSRSNDTMLLKIKVLFLLAATDFLISLDSVIAISGISQHVMPVAVGIFFSLLFSLFYLPLIVKIATFFPWINIIVGGIIAQNAIIGIVNDPLLADWIYDVNVTFPEVDIVHLVSNAVVILVVVIGLIAYMNHYRTVIHK